MVYRESILLRKVGAWEKLREEAYIYELELPNLACVNWICRGSLAKKIELNYEAESKYSWREGRRKESTIVKVTALWVNPKKTIMALLIAKPKLVALFSRNETGRGWTGIPINRYDDDSSDIFDNLRVGSFLVTGETTYRGEECSVGFICNEPNLEDVERLVEALTEMNRKRYDRKHNSFDWGKEDTVESAGTVTLKEVLKQKVVFQKALRRFSWMKRKDRWVLLNSVKANLKMKKGAKFFTVKAKALDGKTYILKTTNLPDEEKALGYRDTSIYKIEFWLPFVYRAGRANFMNLTPAQRTEELVAIFLRTFHRLPNQNLTLQINRRKVVITRKQSIKGAQRHHLDGCLIALDSCIPKLRAYFLQGEPITPPPPKGGSLPRRRVLSKEAENLIEKGLNGTMRDLEGEFPFHLNLVYVERTRKWYLEIGGKKFYVKGGQVALKKIRSAIEGRAIVDRRKYGWQKRGTTLIMDRITELVGRKNALWIVLHVKRMGAMMKAIGK